MTYVYVAIIAALLALRLWRRRRGKRSIGARGASSVLGAISAVLGRVSGPVGLVALREVRERVRTRFFRIGTVIVLLVVAAAIVLPVLHKGSTSHERVAVVGTASAPVRASVLAVAAEIGSTASVTSEPTVSAAERALRAGTINLAVVGNGARQSLLVDAAFSPSDTSATAQLAIGVADSLGRLEALEAAGIAPEKIGALAHPTPLSITSLQHPRADGTAKATAVYALILLFVLLSQYGTWVLMGVVEEKSTRVVEVLLAAVRPGELLAGKVLGIGAVALGQGALIVAVALGLAKAVGSDVIRGAALAQLFGVLVWLVVGYAFYCWVYAAAGSLAERQEHVQSLAFPLQLPILFGYITSLTALGSSSPSTLIEVLAYLPPTAPFAMPALIALGGVTWWQFTASVALSLAATYGVARLAATVYTRAVLRTGRRIHLREVLFATR